MAAEDVRFARTIERIQKIFVSELTKIAIVHLYTQGYKDEDLVNFSLELTNPSLVYEKQKVEILNEKIGLANTMKESNMFSERWIYENLFNMSQNEWTIEQEQVIEDLKQRFRHEQITSEGNDPRKTNLSFGTPHDIATMHTATSGELLPGQEQEHVGGSGRPKGPITGKSHKSALGRDPLGIKQISKAFDTDKSPLQHNFRNGPFSMETIDKGLMQSLMNSRTKSQQILKESLQKSTEDKDKGTILDESQLLDD